MTAEPPGTGLRSPGSLGASRGPCHTWEVSRGSRTALLPTAVAAGPSATACSEPRRPGRGRPGAGGGHHCHPVHPPGAPGTGQAQVSPTGRPPSVRSHWETQATDGSGSCPSTGPACSAQAQGVGARTLAIAQAQMPVQSSSCACRWGARQFRPSGGAFWNGSSCWGKTSGRV